MSYDARLEYYFPAKDLGHVLDATWVAFAKAGAEPDLKYTCSTPLGVEIRSPFELSLQDQKLMGYGHVEYRNKDENEIEACQLSMTLSFGEKFVQLVLSPPSGRELAADNNDLFSKLRTIGGAVGKTAICLWVDDYGTFLMTAALRQSLVIHDLERGVRYPDDELDLDPDERVASLKEWIKTRRAAAKQRRQIQLIPLPELEVFKALPGGNKSVPREQIKVIVPFRRAIWHMIITKGLDPARMCELLLSDDELPDDLQDIVSEMIRKRDLIHAGHTWRDARRLIAEIIQKHQPEFVTNTTWSQAIGTVPPISARSCGEFEEIFLQSANRALSEGWADALQWEQAKKTIAARLTIIKALRTAIGDLERCADRPEIIANIEQLQQQLYQFQQPMIAQWERTLIDQTDLVTSTDLLWWMVLFCGEHAANWPVPKIDREATSLHDFVFAQRLDFAKSPTGLYPIELSVPAPFIPPIKPSRDVCRQLIDEPSLERASYPIASCVREIPQLRGPFTLLSNTRLAGSLTAVGANLPLEQSITHQKIGVYAIETEQLTIPERGSDFITCMNLDSSADGRVIVWDNIGVRYNLSHGSRTTEGINRTRLIDLSLGGEFDLGLDCEFGHIMGPESDWIAGLSFRDREFWLSIHKLTPGINDRTPTRIRLKHVPLYREGRASFAYLAERHLLAVTFGNQTVVIDFESHKRVATMIHEVTVTTLSLPVTRFSPNGEFLAAAAGGVVDVYATCDWRVVARLAASQGCVSGIEWLGDGQSLLVLARDGFSRWHLPSGSCQWFVDASTAVRQSRADERFYAASFDVIHAWNPVRELMAIQHETRNHMKFTLVRNADGNVIAILPTDTVTQLKFGPDGQHLMSATQEIAVWSMP